MIENIFGAIIWIIILFFLFSNSSILILALSAICASIVFMDD